MTTNSTNMSFIRMMPTSGATYEFPVSEISYLFSSPNANIYRVHLKHNDVSFEVSKKQYQKLRKVLAESIGVTDTQKPVASISSDDK